MSNKSKFITFVLGAGSSFEVGMPTGNGLKGGIASSLSFSVDRYRGMGGGDAQIRECFNRLSKKEDKKILLDDYYKAAELIAAGMPQALSIDNFIDSHRSNGLIAEVGKVAIVSQILQAESQSKLYVDPSNIYNKLNFPGVSETWFNAFFQLLCQNAQEGDLPEMLSRVRVITFNYDRTLEHFLFHSIQNYYGTSSEKAVEIISNLKIIHPYGKVGNLPWQKLGMDVPFGGEVRPSVLLNASNLIRTFTEGTSRSESDIDLIHSSIFNCEILTFLGFAYHELNLKLLFGEHQNSLACNANKVFGTAKGMSESNVNSVRYELQELCGISDKLIVLRRDLSASELLSEYSRSLRVPVT